MNLLDIALGYAARGWHVFPCWPATKRPMTPHGWKDASTDEAAIRAWWSREPQANVAIACGPSGLAVVDADHGIADDVGFHEWLATTRLPSTLAVRTGRRPEFGVQMYFAGSRDSVQGWELEGATGDVKSVGGYVMAAGSVHPSGERYEVIADAPVVPMPDAVARLEGRKTERVLASNEPITEMRNDAMIRILGKLREAGLTDDLIRENAVRVNAERMAPPLDEDELDRLIANACKFPVPVPEPAVVIGKTKESPTVSDWREWFHTREEAEHAPPITFLIDGFLQREGVTAIAGPVRERKSLIALNVAHALLTGEKLFDYFEVTKRPSRVLYLCPEVSLGPFTDRLKKIGLMDYVGDTLFYRTLSSANALSLSDESLRPALPGSVVILDTAIRFLEGDENSSQDIRAFADGIFALLRHGAESVVMLHHSPKDSGDFMTLENAMRGSGDMGAFLACCWGTKLQDQSRPYESASFVSNLKQRDFESKDFELTGGPDCRLHIVGDPATRAVSLQTRRGNRANKDGKDEVAEAAIAANLKLPVRKMQEHLATLGIKRGTTWVSQVRARLQIDAGGPLTAG